MTLSSSSLMKSIKMKLTVILTVCLLAPTYARSSEDERDYDAEEESEIVDYVRECEVAKKDCQTLKEMYESQEKNISFWDTTTGKVVIFVIGAGVGYGVSQR